jgi:hypothetical protein
MERADTFETLEGLPFAELHDFTSRKTVIIILSIGRASHPNLVLFNIDSV